MYKIVISNRAFLYCWMIALFFLHPIFQQQAYSALTQGKLINISAKNTSLAAIVRQVAKKGNLTIYFLDSDLSEFTNITYEAKNKLGENILHELLDDRGFLITTISSTQFGIRKNTVALSTSILSDTTITVSGKITNEKGDPIASATVLIKGTRLGTTSGSDGSFKITEVKPNASIIITNVAYLTKEISLRGKGYIGTTQLEEYVSILDEAQIIAYGKTSRRLNTGDVTTVKADDIARQPVNNPLLALSGRVPGLQITQVNGISGGGIKVLIQGQNSLSYGNDPFYVIDGVPYISQLLPNLGSVLGSSKSAGVLSEGNTGNPLSFINPQDIESIEVLKDADATAIYGSRAANGAILITTKKGKPGQTKVDFNLQTGFSKVTRKMDLLNTQQYLEMRNEALKNDGIAAPSGTDYDIDGTWDTTRYTDWQKELIGKVAKYNDAQFTISGGNGLTNYLIGGNYHKETTVFLGDLSDQKGSLHFNINSTSQNKKFKISLTGTYLTDDNHLIGIDLTNMAMVIPPHSPAGYNKDGTLNWGENANGISTILSNYQPYAALKKKYQNKTNNLISNINLSYEIVNGLEISSSVGYTNMQSNDMLYLTLPSAYQPELGYPRTVQFGDNNIKSWIVEPKISYKGGLGAGQISVLVGSTVQQRNNSRQLLEATGFNSDLVMDNINAATNVVVPENSTIASVYKYNALFGRINYNLQDRYIINLTARRDGSSRFGSENHFHNFGAIGAAWIFSTENWVKDNINFLSFGKLRGSYGTIGNDQIGDYAFMSLYNNTNPEIPYRGVGGLTPANIANPYLQWEETKKIQAGLELGFAHDNLILNTTYFRNRSSNQLLFYVLPIATGVASILTNLPATIQNSGWEFAITSNNIKRKYFTWSTNINLTIPSNKMVKYKNISISSYSNTYAIGKPFTTTRLFKYNDVNETSGVYEFTDKDGKVIQDPTNDALNKTVIVNTAQRFYGGISNTFSYKGFQLDVLFQFIKQKGLNSFFGNLPGINFLNQPITVLDRWQKPGDNSAIQKYNSDDNISNSQNAVTQSSAAWADASYIRLKNISLSWKIPEYLGKKLRMKNFRLFIQGQNLLTFTNYIGLDPETLSSYSLPPLRVITFGINATL